jgi:hypothetical protein
MLPQNLTRKADFKQTNTGLRVIGFFPFLFSVCRSFQTIARSITSNAKRTPKPTHAARVELAPPGPSRLNPPTFVILSPSPARRVAFRGMLRLLGSRLPAPSAAPRRAGLHPRRQTPASRRSPPGQREAAPARCHVSSVWNAARPCVRHIVSDTLSLDSSSQSMYTSQQGFAGAVMSLCKPLTVCPARIEANRRNVQKSIRPRFLLDKVQSRINGLPDGDCSPLLHDRIRALFYPLPCAANGAVRTLPGADIHGKIPLEATMCMKINELRGNSKNWRKIVRC